MDEDDTPLYDKMGVVFMVMPRLCGEEKYV